MLASTARIGELHHSRAWIQGRTSSARTMELVDLLVSCVGRNRSAAVLPSVEGGARTRTQLELLQVASVGKKQSRRLAAAGRKFSLYSAR